MLTKEQKINNKRKLARTWYLRNREKSIEYAKKYNKDNPEKVLLAVKKWQLKNEERDKKNKRNWNKRNMDKRVNYRLKKYGISLEDYNLIFKKQNGVCNICFKANKNNHRLNVDHCHKTGKVRGLLCGKCNTALGLLKDKPEIIMAAFNYIIKNQ